MKNRSNIAASIVQNHELLASVYESSQGAEGSALEENEKFIDSIEGKIQQFQNELQEFWYGLIDSETIKTIIDAGTKILDILGKITDKIGLLGTAAIGVGAALSFKTLSKNSGGRAKEVCPQIAKYATESFSREVCEFWCILE